jgi:hypothetical protein
LQNVRITVILTLFIHVKYIKLQQIKKDYIQGDQNSLCC